MYPLRRPHRSAREERSSLGRPIVGAAPAWSRRIALPSAPWGSCSRTSCSASSMRTAWAPCLKSRWRRPPPLGLRAVGVLLEGGGDEGGDDAPRRPGGRPGPAGLRAKSSRPFPGGAEDRVAAAFALVVVRRSTASRHAARAGPASAGTGPEGLGLRRADRHTQDLAAALVVDGHSHGHRDRDDRTGLAHLVDRPRRSTARPYRWPCQRA